MNIGKNFGFLGLFLFSNFLMAVPAKWFEEKSDYTLGGVTLADATQYLSSKTGVSVEVGAGVGRLQLEQLKLTQKTGDQALNIIAKALNLNILPTNKNGFRLIKKDSAFSNRLPVIDDAPKFDIQIVNASAVEVLVYLSVKANIDFVASWSDMFKMPHSAQGSFTVAQILNDMADVEGLNVHQENGVYYFTPQKTE